MHVCMYMWVYEFIYYHYNLTCEWIPAWCKFDMLTFVLSCECSCNVAVKKVELSSLVEEIYWLIQWLCDGFKGCQCCHILIYLSRFNFTPLEKFAVCQIYICFVLLFRHFLLITLKVLPFHKWKWPVEV